MPTYETLYTGGVAEKEVIGANPDFKKGDERKYLPYEEAMAKVKEIQTKSKMPYNPACPDVKRYPFAYDLYAKVGTLLGFEDEDWKRGKLKFFTALGSQLDFCHGVDGFLELELESGDKVQVTFDITINPNKVSYKADIIIAVPADGFDFNDNYDLEIFDELIEERSEEIAGLFQEKISQLNRRREERIVAYG
ncbi:hypothetical protein KJ840_05775 [Patescibacteria group bacterium]|nr:hypothetical protein [Patescibacteria group bacterium]